MKVLQGSILSLKLLFTVGSSAAEFNQSWRPLTVTQRARSHMHRLLQENESNEACQDAKDEIEQDSMGPDGDLLITCSCRDLILSNMTSLNCINACQFCDSELTVCGVPSFGEVYDDSGSIISFSDSFTYTKNRSDVVNLLQENCTADVMGDTFCECGVTVSGQSCSSCMLNECPTGVNAGFSLPAFDCSNIEEGAVFDLCDDSLVVPSSSVFAFLTTEDDEFVECITETPSSAPSSNTTALPTETGTSPPSAAPSEAASEAPSSQASVLSASPTGPPSASASPTAVSSEMPSSVPSTIPSDVPSLLPSAVPSSIPSDMPSLVPSGAPSPEPSNAPTNPPTQPGASASPTKAASSSPSTITASPSVSPSLRTNSPSADLTTLRPTTAEPSEGAPDESRATQWTHSVLIVAVSSAVFLALVG